jgi:hypothetical protein
MLSKKFAAAATMMDQAKEEVLALRTFPPGHWSKNWNINLLEWLNKEIKDAKAQ